MEKININETINIVPELVKNTEKTILFYLSGYLDNFNSKAFQNFIEPHINQGYIYLIFDLQELDYISSSGIGSFVKFNKILSKNGGQVYLLNISEKIKTIFTQLGFISFFKLVKSVEEVIFKNKSNQSSFPLIIKCIFCEKKIKISKPSQLRCPFCEKIFYINDKGEISS